MGPGGTLLLERPVVAEAPASLLEALWSDDRASRVASAPCNYGAFELAGELPDPDRVLAAIRDAGYAATDLGPVGFLGEGRELRERLERFGLRVAGGWVQLSLESDDLDGLERALDAFEAASGHVPPDELPHPTLALDGPARPLVGGPAELDDEGWLRLASLVEAAARRCRRRGFEPTFHPHVGTWVETWDHVQRLLDGTDVPLCLDTGHMMLGGIDPLEGLVAWGPRINHVHVKDVRLALFEELRAAAAPLTEVWARRVFCPLGRGDADLDAFLDALREYRGWLVVEQDRLLRPGESLEEAAEVDRTNRDFLRWHGW